MMGPMKNINFLAVLALSLITVSSYGAKVEVSDETSQVKSEQEASKYFRKKSPSASSSSSSNESAEHYLAVHFGSFVSSKAYKWGDREGYDDAGKLNVGMTYRLDAFSSLIDSAVRADLLGYDLPEGRPLVLSALFMLMLPDANSQFPLYFGLGVGPGFFINQLSNESYLSVHYQAVAGVRFFNVIESVGFFLEGGLKNHLFLLSDGQFNGFFITIGSIFTF